MTNIGTRAVDQLQADYDRLLNDYNALLAAGDEMAYAGGALASARRAELRPSHEMWSRLERATKTWRSAAR